MRQILLFLLFTVLATAAYSQVQVSQEPRHHKVLENEYVRVLDVHLPPHDTTLMHKHSTPSVFIVLSNTKTGSEVLIEPGKPAFTDGNIWFEGFYDKPRVHRVWNEDTVEFHVMDIELPHTPGANFFVMNPPFSRQIVDEKPVRVYRVSIPPGAHLVFPRSSSPLLVVGLSGPAARGVVNHQPFAKKGDYLFLPGGSPLAVGNDSPTAEQEFALIYLK